MKDYPGTKFDNNSDLGDAARESANGHRRLRHANGDQHPGGRREPTEAAEIEQRIAAIAAELHGLRDKDPRVGDLFAERLKLQGKLADIEAQRMLDAGDYESPAERLQALARRDADQWARAQLDSRGWTPPQELSEDDIEKLPDPVPLIEGILDQGTVGVLSGENQTGKSFLALAWALCVAYGTSWLTHVARGGDVLYVAAEDGAGLKFRRRAWRKHHKIGGKGRIHFYTQAFSLTVPEQVDWLISRIQAHDACFAVIDTYAKCAGGAEENSASDTRRIITQLYRLRNAREGGVTVLLIHHTGYNTARARGSSALVDNVDFAYNMERDGDAHVYTELTAKKRKDAAPPAPMGFRLTVIELDEGGSSCVLVPVDVRQEDGKVKLVDQRIARIRQARQDNPGATQNAVATLTGIPQTTVNRLWPRATI